jgi:hypothetical protein
MVGDIEADLPPGATFFVVDQEEPPATIRHVLEKVHIPLTVVLDTDGNIGATLYDQPRVVLPFGRSYVIDTTTTFDPLVYRIFTGYDPHKIMEAIDGAL